MAFRILLPSGTHVATVDSREQAEADADFYAFRFGGRAPAAIRRN
jgi:hypothetical protein